jgi:fatty acid desaturase
MFMHVPCYNLPRAHRLLAAKSVTERMLIEPGGYRRVLALASSKA